MVLRKRQARKERRRGRGCPQAGRLAGRQSKYSEIRHRQNFISGDTVSEIYWVVSTQYEISRDRRQRLHPVRVVVSSGPARWDRQGRMDGGVRRLGRGVGPVRLLVLR